MTGALDLHGPTGDCCNATPRRSVSTCFDRGRRRQRLPELPYGGRWIAGADQVGARFSVELSGHLLSDIRFRATTCITLVAYCELLCETARGMTPLAAMHLRAAQLVSTLPGVPEDKQDRAAIAITSLHSALVAIMDTNSTTTVEES
ncbi:MAG: iron-sulfur cluster assembly scaffold protein [Aquisalimonadaceae bacterium]